MVRRGNRKDESWTAIRRRLIRETEVFLEIALRNENQMVIPARPVGAGGFSRNFAEAFWAQLLATS